MFYKIRRQDRALAEAEAEKILAAAPYGILSLVGENGYPYGVPVNAAWQDGKLYFHCAAEGRKLDAIAHCEKACFTAVLAAEVRPEEFTTYYQSAVAFGKIRLLSSPDEKRAAMEVLLRRFAPGLETEWLKRLETATGQVVLAEMAVEQLTGKKH